MSKPVVVLADLDANYLVPLEDKLTEELYNQIELEVITDEQYFREFFSAPRRIDTLVISSNLFSQDLCRHNIADIFILTEDQNDNISADNITRIFKYTSTKEILNHILSKNKRILDVQFSHKQTQVIVVTSAVGGSGKTMLSLALSENLSRNHKRVFYISTDNMQSFTFYLKNKFSMPNDIVRVLSVPDNNLYSSLIPYLRNEGFTYLPPFGRNILSIGLDNTIYNRLIEAITATKDYDYIVIDTDVNLDAAKAELIEKADKVIINVLQDAYSTYKTEFLVRNMDCRNNEKFIFVCNKFRRDINNDYIVSDLGQQFIISEYIDEIASHQIHSLSEFSDLSRIERLAYLLE